MPPHCDTMDGPVVKAARAGTNTGRLNDFRLSIEIP
jgi:hypothetical protein